MADPGETTETQEPLSILNVALMGSSGGGMATLGQEHAAQLLQTIQFHLSLIRARLVHAMYISLLQGKSMDSVQADTDLAQWIVATLQPFTESTDDNQDDPKNSTTTATTFGTHVLHIQVVATDTLDRINRLYAQPWLDTVLARAIRTGTIHALIGISMHVPLCRSVLDAAVQSQIPLTGSGGSSLAHAAALGVRLVGNAGGSIATTTQTRALSYTYSLAQTFGRTHLYKPWKSSTKQDNDDDGNTGPESTASWTSTLNASLPAFWAVALSRFFLQNLQTLLKQEPPTVVVPFLSYLSVTRESISAELDLIQSTLNHFVLPTVCAILMATRVAHSKTTTSSSSLLSSSCTSKESATASLVMAATMASAIGCRGSIVAGLIAGHVIQAWMEPWVMIPSLVANVPATMTTLLAAGGWGSVVGSFMACTVTPLARWSTALVRRVLSWTVTDSAVCTGVWYAPLVAAFVWGCLSCASSKVGYYHALHLPLILVELEQPGSTASFLGAVDELTLVVVCAGICAAKVLVTAGQSSTSTNHHNQAARVADRALCQRGLWINLMFGDFVEVCYPYMEESRWINVSGYVASGLSCAVLVWTQSHSIASSTTSLSSMMACTPSAVWTSLGSSTTTTTTTVVPPLFCVQPPASMAYLPWIVSVVVAGPHWYAMMQASCVAFVIPFVTTLVVDSWKRRGRTPPKPEEPKMRSSDKQS